MTDGSFHRGHHATITRHVDLGNRRALLPTVVFRTDDPEMARAAERLGFSGLTVPEHHFINILMNPNPFILAVKVASVTEHIPITTAVAMSAATGRVTTAGSVIGQPLA